MEPIRHFEISWPLTILHSKKKLFICILGESMTRQSAYGFIWPLEGPKICWDASFLSFNKLPEFINGAFDPSYFDRTSLMTLSLLGKFERSKETIKNAKYDNLLWNKLSIDITLKKTWCFLYPMTEKFQKKYREITPDTNKTSKRLWLHCWLHHCG